MPTGYEDVAAAFGRMEYRLQQWEQSRREFAEKLILGLAAHNKVPDSAFTYSPDAAVFDDDGWLRAPFTLGAGPQHGALTVLLRIRREGDTWVVAHAEHRYRLPEGDEEQRRAFYESVFKDLVGWLDNVEEPTHARGRIGYAVGDR